jgi:VWFA-related protein
MINSELNGIRIRRKGRSLFAGALFFLVVAVLVLQPGLSPPAMTQEQTVTFDVAVIERDANAFGSLTKEEFTVYEDGVKQQIITLNAQESPFSLGIAIDASGSMRPLLPLIQKTAQDVISRLSGADEACIVSFKAEPKLIQDFTSNQRALAHAVGEIYTSGATGLFNAVVATADHVYKKGKSRRKAALFITDGLDKNSSVKEDKVVTTLIENQAQAYFVCLPVHFKNSSMVMETSLKPSAQLDRLARATGGQTFYIGEPEESASTAAKLIGSLRRQYEITYASTNNKQDGKLRKVRVVASPKDGRKLNVITRQGYYGPGHIRAADR